MAEVFKAVEFGVEGFERTVAVKRILPHVAEDEEFIAMFKDEARIAVQLTHSSIAQIYSLGHEQDSFYIALEYVAGRDLRTIFEYGRKGDLSMPVAQACFITMKVCEGLDYAHNKKDKYGRRLNIIHRDVSPPNVLVSYEGEVKLIDFGVAKAAGRASQTQAGILKGKFGYMSPEQVKGMPLDRRSDVFSLGVCLWEILCGQRLFQGETDFATLEKVRSVDVTPPSRANPEVSPELERIIFKALAADPEERYQSAMEFHDELQAFMFAQGMFYSRKELAAWMRDHFAREIELEKEKAKQRAEQIKQVGGTGQRKTMIAGGGGPPPPPGRKAPPPPPKRAAAGSTGSSSKSRATAAHRPVPAAITPSGDSGPSAPPRPPSKPGGGPPRPGGRQRAKTMMMTNSKPDLARPGAPSRPPAPGRPKPVAAAPRPTPKHEDPPEDTGGGDDFDWDDDELETRLFDDEKEEAAGNTAAQTAIPATAAQVAAQGQPAPPPSYSNPQASQPQAQPMAPAPAMQSSPMMAPQQPMHSMGQPMQAHSMPHAGAAPAVVPAPASPEPKSNKTMLIVAIGLLVVTLAVLAVVFFTDIFGGGDKSEGGSGEAAVAANEGDKAEKGGLTLELTPSDATVKLDGAEVSGSGSPRVLSDLAAGKHELSVDGGAEYLPYAQEVTVMGGVATPFPVKLQSKKVTVTFETTPEDAKLALVADGKETEIESTHVIERVAGAEYKIKATAPGYKEALETIKFDGESTQTVKVALVGDGTKVAAKDPPPTNDGGSKKATNSGGSSKNGGGGGGGGTKKVSKPKNAELVIGVAPGQPPAQAVYVDGKKVGSGAVVKTKVAAGTHTVKWKWADGSASQKVTVAANEKKVVKGKKG